MRKEVARSTEFRVFFAEPPSRYIIAAFPSTCEMESSKNSYQSLLLWFVKVDVKTVEPALAMSGLPIFC